MAFSLLIAGAPYSWKAGTLNIVETLGGRSTCEFSIDNPDGTITAPRVGQSVIVKDGAHTIFAGSIETVEAVRYPATFAGLWRVSCVDHHRILDRRITGQRSWQSARAGEIVTDICTTYLGGEGVGVEFIQQGPVIERFEIDHATIAEALQRLAELANMIWYVDYGRQLRFFVPNSYACPFELEPDSRNFGNLVLRSTREQYANRIIAKIGQFVRDPQTARFDAQGRSGDGEEPLDWMKPDGARKRWAVTYPVHARPTVRVNGAERTVGSYGDADSEFYWQTGSREIGQSDSSAALGVSDVLEITYIGLSSEVLTVEDAGEISRRAATEGHTGIYEKLVDTSQEMTRSDARQYALAALDKLDSLSQVAVVDTNTFLEPLAPTARAGQFIHIDVDGYRLDWKTVTVVQYGAPCIITIPGHGLMNGARIRLHAVAGLNGAWSVQVVDEDRLSLVGSDAAGTYTGGGYAYPLTYLIRQVRSFDVAGQLAVQLECFMGPATDDAASFFRDLAAAQGIPPSAPRPDKIPGDLPSVSDLTAAHALDLEKGQVLVTLQCTAPEFADLAGIRPYVEIPQENDPDIQHPTMPGQLFRLGSEFAEAGQPVKLQLSLPFPPLAWLQSKKQPNQPLLLTWVFYVTTESWNTAQQLKRLTSINPPSPADASPWVSLTMDFTEWLEHESLTYVHPAIVAEHSTIELAGDQVRIRAGWHPVFPSVSVAGVNCFTSTAADQQNRPHGYYPYEADPEAPLPLNLGWVEARIDKPASLPATVVLQIAARYSDGYEHSPARILWDQEGNPLTVPSPHGIALTITAESLSLTAPSITAASVEFQQAPDGRWQYRVVVALSGGILAQPHYGGSDIRMRFAAETGDWETVRVVAEHRPGDQTTVRTPWYDIRPGTSEQFYLRAEARDRSGLARAWSDPAGPFSLSLPLGNAVPGAGHNFGLSATLVGYTSDGNGVLYGQVQVSWTPLPQPGLVYGFYEYRSTEPDPPPYAAYRPTEANTTDSALTMWVQPPVNDLEYLHLALVVSDPAQGLWPKPADYQAGQLAVATVQLPRAGLPQNVTGFSVVVGTDQSADIPTGWYEFAFTPPAGDANWDGVHIYRRPANAQGDPIAAELPEPVARIRTPGRGGTWPLPPEPEYWLFRCASVNPLGQEQTSGNPVALVPVPASSGVTAAKLAPGAATGPVAVDEQGRVTIPSGAIQAQHIATVGAGSITGLIASNQIGSIEASKITGQITASQIQSISADKITGSISASQISSVNANQISGVLQSSQIQSVSAAQITGVIVSQQLADQVLNSARLMAPATATPVRVTSLPSLPSADYPVGALILRTGDRTLWRNQSNVWVQVNPSAELTGSITSQDISSVNATSIVGLITAGQIESVSATQITGSIQSYQIASIEASKITGQITASQIQSVNAGSIQGLINNGQINFIYANKLVSDSLDYATGNLYVLGYVNIASNPFAPGSGTLYCGSVSAYNWGVNGSGQGIFQSVQAYTGNFITSLVVNGQTLGNAAFRNVGAGAGDVAAGDHTHSGYASSNHSHPEYASSNHTHPIAVTLSVQTKTINYVDAYDQQTYSETVVTGVSVQSVTCGTPQ